MPDLDDQIQDMDPSTVSNDDAAPAPADAAAANSSLATPGETEDDGLLSVVRDVVDARTQPEDQSASPAEGEEDEGQAQADADDEDYSNVPFSKHPDFRRLVRKKNEYRDKAQAFEQDAVRYQNVQNFMDQNGLSAEEAADGLTTFALAKTNPVEAWKLAKPWVQQLLVAAGEVLPDELKTRVQNGELSHEAALEVSRTRAMSNSMQATQSFQEQRRQKEQQTTAASAITQAATDWEDDRRKKDPNFEAKMPLLMREIAFLQRRDGVPNTPEGVQAQLKAAYKSIVLPAAPAAAAPRPAVGQPKKPITPVRGGQVAGGAKPEIKDTMDVLKNVIGRRSA
jgi:hypothetical protein